MATQDVLVPDIGDFHDVPVIDVLVKPGDKIAAEAPLVTLESDKATMDVPAPFAGTVRELKVKVGDKVSQGTAILAMEVEGAGAKPAAPQPSAAPSPKPPETPAPGPGSGRGTAPVEASRGIILNSRSKSRSFQSTSAIVRPIAASPPVVAKSGMAIRAGRLDVMIRESS